MHDLTGAWEKLDATTEDNVWERLQTEFLFHPGAEPEFLEPAPSITYSLSILLQSEGELFLRYALDVNSKLLSAFSQCLAPEQKLYALDWQHQCYWFSPRKFINFTEPTSWLVTLFPYGDYSLFLTEDFSLGTCGHPWQQTLCVFGECLLRRVQKDVPANFREIRRQTSA